MDIAIFWFRRDLRLTDNIGLNHALDSSKKVLPIFIFDTEIINDLEKNDARVTFIYKLLEQIHIQLKNVGSSLIVKKGKPIEVWKKLLKEYTITEVYANKDYEPYARERDEQIKEMLKEHHILLKLFKDQVIFEENDVIKNDGNPYTVFTPYKNKWLQKMKEIDIKPQNNANSSSFYQCDVKFPKLETIGFDFSKITVKNYQLHSLKNYAKERDIPARDGTSYLGPHLRFGSVSVRQLIAQLKLQNEMFLSELIWREFFMQILFHFPRVVTQNFRSKYDGIKWRNNPDEFKAWCQGKTGYPLVDAGMRQLIQTGYMHNRVRMVVASFLCKHLLTDWRRGEAYFADKLLDYELSSNNGNWQWSAGTGCDAAPYFRIFNPSAQFKKFDNQATYVLKWVPEYGTSNYCLPIVAHKTARDRALEAYRVGIR